MAGHSKWANIRHRRGNQDKRDQKFSHELLKKLQYQLVLEVGSIDSNSRLRRAVSNAKSNNMASDKIDRAIKKGIGDI